VIPVKSLSRALMVLAELSRRGHPLTLNDIADGVDLHKSTVHRMLATFVEATFSTGVVQFYVYRAWWFGALYGLLAVNIFCAAAIRFPWKRHQTGFVITHIGLLTLLFSGVLSRTHGIDSQVHVWEDQSSHLAFDYGFSFYLTVEDDGTGGPTEV
jgi:hypothetical protein